MDYFAGLDVSVKETSVCIVDDAGKIVREASYSVLAEAGLPMICVKTKNSSATIVFRHTQVKQRAWRRMR
jgi:hypothetical protein